MQCQLPHMLQPCQHTLSKALLLRTSAMPSKSCIRCSSSSVIRSRSHMVLQGGQSTSGARGKYTARAEGQ